MLFNCSGKKRIDFYNKVKPKLHNLILKTSKTKAREQAVTQKSC